MTDLVDPQDSIYGYTLVGWEPDNGEVSSPITTGPQTVPEGQLQTTVNSSQSVTRTGLGQDTHPQ